MRLCSLPQRARAPSLTQGASEHVPSRPRSSTACIWAAWQQHGPAARSPRCLAAPRLSLLAALELCGGHVGRPQDDIIELAKVG